MMIILLVFFGGFLKIESPIDPWAVGVVVTEQEGSHNCNLHRLWKSCVWHSALFNAEWSDNWAVDSVVDFTRRGVSVT